MTHAMVVSFSAGLRSRDCMQKCSVEHLTSWFSRGSRHGNSHTKRFALARASRLTSDHQAVSAAAGSFTSRVTCALNTHGMDQEVVVPHLPYSAVWETAGWDAMTHGAGWRASVLMSMCFACVAYMGWLWRHIQLELWASVSMTGFCLF